MFFTIKYRKCRIDIACVEGDKTIVIFIYDKVRSSTGNPGNSKALNFYFSPEKSSKNSRISK